MSVTIIYADRSMSVENATAEENNLWLSLDDLCAATGWELKPQGVCRGEVCVPIPAGRERDFVRADGKMFNLTALAQLLNQPVVYDNDYAVWFFGEAVNASDNASQSLQAPDFTLPDLDGKLHSLSEYSGRKILLVTWASW
jgi:AhpC/TSA family